MIVNEEKQNMVFVLTPWLQLSLKAMSTKILKEQEAIGFLCFFFVCLFFF